MKQAVRDERGSSFIVRIGGISCQFFSSRLFSRNLPPAWNDYTSSTLPGHDSGIDYTCRISLGSSAGFVESGDPFLTVRENSESGLIRCLSVFRLALSPDPHVPAVMTLHPRDPFTSFSHGVRVLFSFLGAWNDAVLLHSAALQLPCGSGFILPGRSGSGKTTLASLCSGFRIVGDDLIFVKRVKGEFQIRSTPFNNIRSPGAAAHTAPLSDVLFLNNGKKIWHEVQPVAASEAFALLLECAPSAVLHPPTCGKICDFLADMVSSVRTGKLFFLPDSSIEGFLHGYSG